MRVVFLCLLASLAASPLLAQQIEAATRYDYYLADDSSATLLLFGDEWASVETLDVDGQRAEPLAAYDDAARYRIDISSYEIGAHSLSPQAVFRDGRRQQLSLSLTKLPSKPNAVRVDRLTGGLYVDDLPFFPFGFYAGYPVGDLPVQEVYNAMNLIGVYQSNEDETLAGRKAYMDLCASVGMKVNYSVNGLIGTPHNQTDAVISEAEEERRWALLRREVETFKDHPALLSWYMNDEPIGQSRAPELLEKAYQIIKEIDPYHPVSVVFVIPDRAAPFVNTMDIAMTDPYPIPGDVDEVRAHMRSLTKHFRFRKALWLVPQAFGGGEFWRREPTGPEIRAMTWLGIQEGAMGIQYFIRRHPNLFPKSRLAWHEAVRVAHEVSMIQPWLFSEEPRQNLATGSDRIRATALRHDGSTLILVTNEDSRPAPFEIDISSLVTRDSASIQLPFENRSIDAHGGRLSENIDALGSRAYLIEGPNEETADVDRYNLFPNPSFEWVASPGVPSGTYADSDARPAYDGSTFFVDSRLSHRGRNSLRMRAVSDTSHLALSFYRMYVDPARAYHASLWSRNDTRVNPVEFAVSLPGLDLKRNFSTTDTWQRHDIRFKTGSETPFVQLQIETAGSGTFWVDDVVVAPDPLIEVTVGHGPRATVAIGSRDPETALRYTLNEAEPRTYTAPFEVREFTEVKVLVRHPSWPEDTVSIVIPLSLATLKETTFATPYSEKYTGSGPGTLVDGEYGSLAFRDGKYLGFDGKDVDFTIDLDRSASIGAVTAHFLVSPDDGIHAPLAVEAWTSPDAEKWTPLGDTGNLEASRPGGPYHMAVLVQGRPREARFVRVKVASPKVIGEGYLFSGTDAWLFLDEVLVDRE